MNIFIFIYLCKEKEKRPNILDKHQESKKIFCLERGEHKHTLQAKV